MEEPSSHAAHLLALLYATVSRSCELGGIGSGLLYPADANENAKVATLLLAAKRATKIT